MKKRFVMVLAVILAVTVVLLGGCSSKKEFQCAACERTVKEEGHVVSRGEEKVRICDDCYAEWQQGQGWS